jgi:hypothetical protein
MRSVKVFHSESLTLVRELTVEDAKLDGKVDLLRNRQKGT